MWITQLLSQVASIVPGNSVPAKQKDELYTGVEGMPYVATKDIGFDGIIDYQNGICIPENYLNKFKISPIGATLICAEGGSAGRKIAYSLNECCYVNKLVSFQPNKKIVPKFLYYFALSAEFQSQFRDALHGLIGGVSLSKMKSFNISYPPLTEQQRIVAKLDAAFAEINKTIDITQNNLKSSQIIFSKYLKNIFDTKHAGYVSSTIAKTCTIKSGTTVKPNIERTAGKLPYLKVADMNLRENEKEITTSSRFLDIADVRKNSIIEPGSTIFPKRGGAIATNKKRIVTTPICIDLNIMSVLPKKNVILPELLYYYFINLDLKKLGSGSSIPQVNNYDIEPLFISCPNKIEDQDKAVNRINKLYAETNMLKNIYKKKIESLKNLKNNILSEFLNESKTKKVA